MVLVAVVEKAGGAAAQGQGASRLGRFLSRQSSTTSTSTSSGNLADHLTPRSGSTSTSGSVYDDNMETLDPRQQFDLSDHALLDGIFKRVLDWNNAHAAMQMARGSPAGKPPHKAGRRVQDTHKDKQMSPTSDITHVKKRRDLIIPDEEEELSFSHSYRRKPELKGKSSRSSNTSSTGMSSFSSKQASSDSISVLSSMSSMSQSQDLPQGYRDPVGASWKEHANQAWREYYQQQGWRPPDPGGHSWREQMMSGLPPAAALPPPPHPMMPSAYLSTSMLSRGMSMESMNSFGVPSPPESFMYGSHYVQPPPVQNHAESVLMNLGFGSSDGFLPERFMRDWSATVSASYDLPDIASALPSGGQQSRIDRLKEYIDAYAQNMNSSGEGRAMRMRQFASSRQKSLPSYLETLTEEDEAKTRHTSYNPHDRESRLQAFLREDSLSTTDRSDSCATSSGRASNEQSLCGSESELLQWIRS
nr:hypothetical protein BaRGS_001965 [Batillaria attramentaria]